MKQFKRIIKKDEIKKKKILLFTHTLYIDLILF